MASLFVVLAYSVCRCQSEQKQMILTIEMDSLVLTNATTIVLSRTQNAKEEKYRMESTRRRFDHTV